MKKIILFLLTMIMMLSIVPIAFATQESSDYIEYLDDGSYLVVSIESGGISRITNTKTAKKTITHKDSDGEILWSATLKGSFSYDGSSATCTSSNITYSIADETWKLISANATKSENKALADIVVRKYALGIPFKTIEKTITIACSANGTIS